MERKRNILFLILVIAVWGGCREQRRDGELTPLKISENKRYFTDGNGNPFFWLGDTGWLLFSRLNREEADDYLENRKEKGFNVIQVMVLHSLDIRNAYGDSALVGGNVAEPLVTPGNNADVPDEYDYWDHVDYVIGKAAEKKLMMALVPVWGSNVKSGGVNRLQAQHYAEWLGQRYRERPNIIWLNGGDIPGSDSLAVWQVLGKTLRKTDPNHLITFHPRGRMQSSDWFHQEEWLDFNMFQSGHRRYDQDDTERNYGEDNWRYVTADYNLIPVKPTLDGEPSYEGIPQGLHDTLQPLWKDQDVRRYAYWSVFSGACGFTYGHSAVMQFYKNGESGAYGNKKVWTEAMDDPGACQMIHLKNLMLSKPYFGRIPDQGLIAGDPGLKYDYSVATRGEDYALIYTYNGKNIRVNMGKIKGSQVKASWYSPVDGNSTEAGIFSNQDICEFDPPGDPADGNDWVLILDSVE